MKSILLGGDKLFSVFSPETVAFLQQEAALCPTPFTKEDLLQNPAAFADVRHLFATWGMPMFTEDEIKTVLPSLQAVFYAAGSVQAFARPFLACGVKIFSAWGANAVPVVEYTVSQIILANKGFFGAARRYTSLQGHKDAHAHFSAMPGNYGTTVGIIGAGMIGRAVIGRLQEYRLHVLVYDPFLSEADAQALGAEKTTLEDLFARSQTISNHVADLPETVGMLDASLFARMKDNATFLNTGRGRQVVEQDLIEALRTHPDRTAVLDVTAPEPPEAASPLYTLPNVILTPHIAGSSGKEVARMGEYMKEEYIAFTQGAPTRYQVTQDMLARMA